ncbi:FAD/NAD(P)-binding oxidoreductase [uncultured Paludibaculum sp.]|uniref:FAD/NAD(P)-binding oxidoreductase n=1 Tax=uncultured Paludibaculum sp. TaxID=1765020 RepID=UPI002AAAC3EA|nr:FAD/NAD(P)-binding oxidoreductase [uncultured Paludibaculum sp.]
MRRWDVVVVGAGPAGIAAACRAAEWGSRVLVLDDNPAAGGQIWRSNGAEPWVERLAKSGVEVRFGSVVADTLPEARSYVLATGAREQFVPFPGWTLPGVFGLGGMQALVKSGLDVTGKRIVVAGTGPLLLAVASLLRKRGAVVSAVVEQADWRSVAGFGASLWNSPSKVAQGAEMMMTLWGVPLYTGSWVEVATGRGRVERVGMRRGRSVMEQDCDAVAVGYGLIPNTELAALVGCHVAQGSVVVDDWQETSVDGVFAAGEVTGIGGVEKSLVEGEIAGLAAAGLRGLAEKLFARRSRTQAFAARLERSFAPRPELRALAESDTFVCRCEDVTRGALEGMTSWREAKLQTRCGMGSCQGRVCGGATRFLFGWGAESTRPPVFPVKVGSLIEKRQL